MSYEVSAWGIFLSLAVSLKKLEESVECPIFGHDHLAWTSLWKTFLSRGADVDASVFSDVCYASMLREAQTVLEESPLTFLERLMSFEATSFLQELSDLLSAQGAVQRRRCRMALPWPTYEVETEEKFCWYPVSQDQSDRLFALWHWDPTQDDADLIRKNEGFGRLVKEIAAGFTETDRLDPPNFILRSSFTIENKDGTGRVTC